MTPLTSYKNLSTPDNAKNLGLRQSTLIEQRHRGIQYFMVKLFVEGSPSVRKKFYARSALLHGRWLFLAYLQGIETVYIHLTHSFIPSFLAYLQGIETEPDKAFWLYEYGVSSLPTRDWNAPEQLESKGAA